MDFANFTNIARNTSINTTATRLEIDGDELIANKKASFADKLGRAFRVGTPAKGSLQTNIAVRHELAYSLGRELGLDTSDYGKLLKNLQSKLGKDVFDAKMFKDSGLWCGRPLTARRVTRIVNAAIKLDPSIGKLGADNVLLSRIGASEVGDDDEDEGVNYASKLKRMTSEAVLGKLATKVMPDILKGSSLVTKDSKIVTVPADDQEQVQRLLDRGYEIADDKLVDTGGAFTHTKKRFSNKTQISFSDPGQMQVVNLYQREQHWTNADNIFSAGLYRCTPEGALSLVDVLQEAIKEARTASASDTSVPDEARAELMDALDELAARVDTTRTGLVGLKAGEVPQEIKTDLAAMIDLFNLVKQG